jgi:DNA-binding SARP family transcriptional activator
MSRISIQLFGQFCVRRNEQVLAGFEAHKVQELFCYLLLHQQHFHSRESLASMLWPDTTTGQSKKRLRQTIWLLQSALGSQNEPIHKRLLLVQPDRVQVNAGADLWLDVAIFQKAFELVEGLAGRELHAQHVQALQNALQLYRDPLLAGCYEDWCLYEREGMQNKYLAMLNTLVSYCEAHHDYETAILYCTRIISCDRARELTHRRLIRLHYLSGDRSAALHQYKQCVAALDEELDMKPSKRTIALYQQILTEQLVEPEPTLTPAEAQPAVGVTTSSLIEAHNQLTHLQKSLANLQSQIQQNIQQVEHALNTSSPMPSLAKTHEGKDALETRKDAPTSRGDVRETLPMVWLK